MVAVEGMVRLGSGTRTVRTIDVAFRFRSEFAMADVDSSLGIDTGDDDLKGIAKMADILNLLDSVPSEFRNVAEGISVPKEIDKAAVAFNADNLSIKDITDFGDTRDIPDPVVGLIDGLVMDGIKDDTAIIVDINLNIVVAIGNDTIDNLALRSDDFTDFVGFDVELLPL